MSNVLPQNVVTQHTRILRLRLLVVVATCVLFGALMTTLAILPGYVQVRAEKASIELSLAGTGTTTPREARDTLGAVKRRADALSAIAKAQKTNEAITEALAQAPSTVSISGIRYEYGTKGGSLTMSGTAKNRQDILDYVQHLKSLPLFSDANIPINSLTSSGAGRFDIVVTGSF